MLLKTTSDFVLAFLYGGIVFWFNNNIETLENTADLEPTSDDIMGETPPAKKRKNFLFRRCYHATFNPEDVPVNKKTLAPDSDEET